MLLHAAQAFGSSSSTSLQPGLCGGRWRLRGAAEMGAGVLTGEVGEETELLRREQSGEAGM
jgi:hypothetical protein